MSGKYHYILCAIVAFIVGQPVTLGQSPAGSALTYQGQLKKNGIAVTDTCDFEFYLWNDPDASDPANLIGAPLIFSDADALVVSQGLFSATLDFGLNLFGYKERWLGVIVRCPTGSVDWTTLFPRQKIAPAPYALALPGLRTQPDATAPNVIGGSQTNVIANGVTGATISGGNNNNVGGQLGTVAGGDGNVADGESSFAAGHRAKARHRGSFVWGDASDTDLESNKNNQFLVRASGGVGLGTTETNHQLTIAALKSLDPEISDNALRLMGPDGTFQHGARLNFGDANWVYLDEDVDDGLNIHAARRIALTGGNVGIGTTSPTGLLEVFGAVGDSSVVLPKDSISSEEMFNEPGVASGVLSGDDLPGRCEILLDSTLKSIRARQLSAPASGYVLVFATARLDIAHTNLIASEIKLGVSNISSSLPQNQDMGLLLNASLPSGNYQHTITVQGLFNAGIGDSTYYLLAQQISGDIRVCDIQLTLLYIPSAYGIVEVINPGGFQSQSDPVPLPIIKPMTRPDEKTTSAQLDNELQNEIKQLRDKLDAIQQKLDSEVIGLKKNE